MTRTLPHALAVVGAVAAVLPAFAADTVVPPSYQVRPGETDCDGVPVVQHANPIAGFALVVPEDWEMTTLYGGITVVGISGAVGAAAVQQPSLWFAYCAYPPEQEAQLLARDLAVLGEGTPQIQRSDSPDEWVVTMQSNGRVRGPMVDICACRRQGQTSYVIGAQCPPQSLERWQKDIARALMSCHLIPRPIVDVFMEPTERAYSLLMPYGWQWEGRIARTRANPGSFVWTVQTPDGLIGSRTGEPVAFDVFTPYTPAAEALEQIALPYLQQHEAPDMRLERVHRLQRFGNSFQALLAAIGVSDSARVDKAWGDYLFSRDGKQIRLRLTLVTFQLSSSPFLGGAGDWLLFSSAVWAPDESFEKLYPIGRGIGASVQTSPEWEDNLIAVTNDVLAKRRKVMREAFKDWDAHIRDRERVRDPAGGPPQEVPYGDGGVWKDTEGRMHRVHPSLENWARAQGWTPVQ